MTAHGRLPLLHIYLVFYLYRSCLGTPFCRSPDHFPATCKCRSFLQFFRRAAAQPSILSGCSCFPELLSAGDEICAGITDLYGGLRSNMSLTSEWMSWTGQPELCKGHLISCVARQSGNSIRCTTGFLQTCFLHALSSHNGAAIHTMSAEQSMTDPLGCLALHKDFS